MFLLAIIYLVLVTVMTNKHVYEWYETNLQQKTFYFKVSVIFSLVFRYTGTFLF